MVDLENKKIHTPPTQQSLTDFHRRPCGGLYAKKNSLNENFRKEVLPWLDLGNL